jgi:hypothetical protein
MTVFGIALSGLGATIVTQLRLLESLERRAYVLVAQGTALQVTGYDPVGQSLTCVYDAGSVPVDIATATDRQAARLGVARLVNRNVGPSGLPLAVGPSLALSIEPGSEPFEHVLDVSLDGDLVETGAEVTAVVAVAEGLP